MGRYRCVLIRNLKKGLDTDDKTKSSLQTARDFVENLPFSSAEKLDRLMGNLIYSRKA
jgi:hypothetical protein